MADELYPEVLTVATLTALLALGPATTPVPRLDHATIFVREPANRGWWYYDPDAVSGGQTPTSDGVGRWFGPVPYQLSAAGVLGNLSPGGGASGEVAIADLRAALNVITLTTGSAPYYGARAFINFNGTGTIAIKSSGNVSGITDHGTGNYTMTFATAMPDVNYAEVFGNTTSTSGSLLGLPFIASANLDAWKTTGSLRFQTITAGGSLVDCENISVVIFR